MSRHARLRLFPVSLPTIVLLLALTVSSAIALSIPDRASAAGQGPVAAYGFDEGEGSTVQDLTGDGNEGTVEGAEWTKGRYGDALSFNGTSSCVSVPNSASLQLGEEFTIEAWVKPEGSGHEEPIVFKENEGGPEYVMGIGIGASGKLEGWAEWEEITAPEALPQDAWSNLA